MGVIELHVLRFRISLLNFFVGSRQVLAQKISEFLRRPFRLQSCIEICRKADVKGNLVPDAYYAALAFEYGCVWILLDRGFRRYPGLELRHPLE